MMHVLALQGGDIMLRVITLALCLAALAAVAVDAKTLRWAGRGDMQTTDPHSFNENLTNNINSLIYDTLVQRDKDLKLEPALAVSWQQVDPTTWRVKLRPGVKFHDGTPFTADDVVFSFERSISAKSQQRATYPNVIGARKVDDLTVEFTTASPNPVEPGGVAQIYIMNRAWCEKNGATVAQDLTKRDEPYAALHANGTGP